MRLVGGISKISPGRHCERSEAIQDHGKTTHAVLDCFVALLLAMTTKLDRQDRVL
jgi:hypothetical protein